MGGHGCVGVQQLEDTKQGISRNSGLISSPMAMTSHCHNKPGTTHCQLKRDLGGGDHSL